MAVQDADLPVLSVDTVVVRGLRMHARTGLGHAPPGRTPVVLVHGLGGSSHAVAPLARRLAREVPVYAPDLPGFGLSEAPQGAPDVAALADYLHAWLDAEGLRRVSLVARTLGGHVATALAARAPDRIARLVLIEPIVGGPRSLARSARQLLSDATRERPRGRVRLDDDEGIGQGLARLGRMARFATRRSLADELPRVTAPILIVGGARDAEAARREVDESAQLAPAARVIEVPGDGHLLDERAPEVLAEAVLPFLVEDAGARARRRRPRAA